MLLTADRIGMPSRPVANPASMNARKPGAKSAMAMPPRLTKNHAVRRDSRKDWPAPNTLDRCRRAASTWCATAQSTSTAAVLTALCPSSSTTPAQSCSL